MMNNNIIKVIPKGYNVESKDCDCCCKALRDRQDVLNNRKYGCCMLCEVKYRYPNSEKWLNGWRPNLGEIK